MVSTYNPYTGAYNKVYAKLDSERIISNGIHLDL